MKVLKMLLLAVGMMVLATAVMAQECDDPATPPFDGMYTTYAGTILPGRSSETFCTTTPAEYFRGGVTGNTEIAMSWDGTMLNSQWRFEGMAIDAAGAVMTVYAVDGNGNGYVDYSTNYEGGTYWLWGGHSWSDGTDLTGVVTYLNVGTKVTFVGGQVVGMTSNILIAGQFDDCTNCVLEYAISNAIRIWDPLAGPMPADYPPWACGSTSGELFDLCCIVANIVCNEVAVEETTWGAIKEMHK